MKIVLQKWGAKWCGPCIDLKKKGTLEKLVAKYPGELRIEVHDDSESGSAAWEAKADEVGIKNLPTLRWMFDGEELFRTTDTTVAGLEKQLAKARKKAGLE